MVLRNSSGSFGSGLWLLLATALLLVGCSASHGTSNIGSPADDLDTERIASGPDGGDHALSGRASWYGSDFHGQTTASGEPYDMYGFTAAHKTLPFHTIVRVIHPKTRKSVVVRINDRGPYADGRIIDLSKAAARDLDMIRRGTMPVVLRVLQWGDGSRVAKQG